MPASQRNFDAEFCEGYTDRPGAREAHCAGGPQPRYRLGRSGTGPRRTAPPTIAACRDVAELERLARKALGCRWTAASQWHTPGAHR